MRIAYQYKLLPTTEQKARLDNWLSMLRHCYNWILADRFNWYEQNRCAINSCPLICHLSPLREKPEYYGQKRSLVQLKQDRPWYKDVHADVLQDCVKRVKLAYSRFVSGDSKGSRSGKPRFKGRNRYRTLSYPRIKQDCIQGNKIVLPKIGAVKLRLHRSLPPGFLIKTASVTKKADGFYITLSLEDKSVPDFGGHKIIPSNQNSIGIDLGLEKIVSTSTGELILPPKYFRASQEKLARLQQKANKRKKGSRARKLLYRKVAKLHQKTARARKQFHFETAQWSLSKAEVVFVEDLSVKNMSRRCKSKQDQDGNYLPNGQSRKTGLNKSFADAGLSQFVDILSYKAEKAGLKVIKVYPRGTSQHCSNCLNRVPKELSERWHCCYHCGLILDRDLNSAELIKKVGLGASLTKKRSTRKGSSPGETPDVYEPHKGREAHALSAKG